MYLPPHFNSKDRALATGLMRAHPLASLISNDDDGLPFVSPVPLCPQERSGVLVLLGHCARLNPHWRYLQARPTAVVTFLGPRGYMSPSVYNNERARGARMDKLALARMPPTSARNDRHDC